MGWSSWNSFSNTVDSQIVMDQARAMVSSGIQKAGYEYINIDEGWWLGDRDRDGNIVVDPKAWPAIASGEHAGDIANIVRFIHGLGLKAGIYTDAGADGCGTFSPDLGPGYPHEGSEGHYEQDFLQFAQWGFDYVKVDWCGGDRENLDPAIQYAEIARAIGRAKAITGHSLYFSICNWGRQSPWTWAPNIGGISADIWRTGGDIVDPIVANTKNAGRRARFKEVLREFDQAQHPDAQHTGFYNDPDMMVVGMPGLSEQQNRAHMSLWAISGGPLLVGADLTRLTAADTATLTNPEVVGIDQDLLGLPPVRISEVKVSEVGVAEAEASAAKPASGPGPAPPSLQVWSKELSGMGRRAVLLLNRTASPASISVRWSDLGLKADSTASVRDAWGRSDLGRFQSTYSAVVPAADAVLLLVIGDEASARTYLAEMKRSVSPHEQGQLVFSGIASGFPVARIRIVYSNPDKTPRFAELRVNGRVATRIAFPSTGDSKSSGTISIESQLNTDGAGNALQFSAAQGPMPAIQSLAIE